LTTLGTFVLTDQKKKNCRTPVGYSGWLALRWEFHMYEYDYRWN
jgi:hypothetical protein